jgi:hypothetical protein
VQVGRTEQHRSATGNQGMIKVWGQGRKSTKSLDSPPREDSGAGLVVMLLDAAMMSRMTNGAAA